MKKAQIPGGSFIMWLIIALAMFVIILIAIFAIKGNILGYKIFP